MRAKAQEGPRVSQRLCWAFGPIFNNSLICEVPYTLKQSTIIPAPKKFTITGLNLSSLTSVIIKSWHPSLCRLPSDPFNALVCGLQLYIQYNNCWTFLHQTQTADCACLHLSMAPKRRDWQEAAGEAGKYHIQHRDVCSPHSGARRQAEQISAQPNYLRTLHVKWTRPGSSMG